MLCAAGVGQRNLDDESVSGKLIENIMASLAEFYSANLAEEVRKGLGATCQAWWVASHGARRLS